jgi:hypothetical protein
LNSGKSVNFYKTQKNHIRTGQPKYTPFDTHSMLTKLVIFYCSSSPTTYFPPISHILSFHLHYPLASLVFVMYIAIHIIFSLSHIASTFPYFHFYLALSIFLLVIYCPHTPSLPRVLVSLASFSGPFPSDAPPFTFVFALMIY